MTDWAALLRGVNVGGITVRSAELRTVLAGLGLDAVSTVLASGNAVFRAGAEHGVLKDRIEAGLRERFGYDARIILVTRAEIDTAIAGFPFDDSDEGRQPWVLFCADDATRDELRDAATALDPVVDPVAVGDRVVYWNPRKGQSTDTPFAKVIAKRAYKERTTNRNLRTLRRITASFGS